MNAILDRIIVEEPEVKENVTKTGIVLQHKQNRTDAVEYKVISVGQDVKAVKVEDTILATEYAGDKFNYQGKPYRVINEKEVISIL